MPGERERHVAADDRAVHELRGLSVAAANGYRWPPGARALRATLRAIEPDVVRMAHWRPRYFRLVERCGRRRWDSPAIIAASDEHVEDVLVNVAHALSLRAIARMGGGSAAPRLSRHTGAGLGARGFGWSTLLVDLLARRA